MAKNILARRVDGATTLADRLSSVVLDVAGHIPDTSEHKSRGPEQRARAIANSAANRAAIAAGTLALPPGPVGWLTLVPELLAIWHIQRQMVADIAGAYGASAKLTNSQMLYCLFRHAAAQAMRDVAVQVGARLLIQDIPLHALERIAAKIGISVSKRLVGRGIARWLPIIGALGVGAYAYYDTGQVARTAMRLFADETSTATRKRSMRKRAPAS